MIRKFETQDLDAVMQIWLQANLDAHAFIPASFWTDHFEIVRDMLRRRNSTFTRTKPPGKSTVSSV